MSSTPQTLSDLKPGDEVAINDGISIPNYLLFTVKRITPTGQIVVASGSLECRFTADGWEIGASFRRKRLELVTDAIRLSVMRKRLTYYKWEKASPEIVMQVARLLGLAGSEQV